MVDELLRQKKELEEKKLALEKYKMEFRKLHGDINAMIYRANSVGAGCYERRTIDNLKTIRREKVAQLERDFDITPQQIPSQIRDCEDEIILIMDQLEDAGTGHTPQGEQQGQQQSVPDRYCLEDKENKPAPSPLRQSRYDDLKDGAPKSVSRKPDRGGRER